MKSISKAVVAAAGALALMGTVAPAADAYSGTTGKGCTAYQYGRGGSGTCVKYIQTMLNGISNQYSYGGYTLALDGQFGPATDTNVRRFQSFSHVVVDGKIGPKTWQQLCFWAGQVNFAYSSSSAAKRAAWQAAYNAGCYVEKPASNSTGYITIKRY